MHSLQIHEDLSVIINSSVLMLTLDFTCSDKFMQVDRKTMASRAAEQGCSWKCSDLYSALKKKNMGTSFIHVQLSRCQEFCQASHCSVNLVPVKRSVSISLVKHYCQAMGGM